MGDMTPLGLEMTLTREELLKFREEEAERMRVKELARKQKEKADAVIRATRDRRRMR